MNELCRRYPFSGEQHFPKEETQLTSFHRHLMFDDSRKVIFCFVPKVSKTVILILWGEGCPGEVEHDYMIAMPFQGQGVWMQANENPKNKITMGTMGVHGFR